MHILCCASSQTSFKGEDVKVSIHEKLFGHPPILLVLIFNKMFIIDFNVY